jgi:general secretion pathway protein A
MGVSMYADYFGLKEPPFSITPDPRYLYMTERHREALAHLLYGVGEGGGFVQLTGEVGTGKTTLCRCLLEQLPPHVDVALILNPRLTSLELLAAVCDELGVPYPPHTESVKELVDLLYRHLLDAHARGRRTVVIVDEAQNLPADVLEQIRLLTNLETTTDKLLQIILIGQPELIQLLDREDLRQLAQRITARYHLEPFAPEETRSYVRHRLRIAGRTRGIFTEQAIRRVHRESGGIARLVNVICDRALLGAYALEQTHVDERTVAHAAAEVRGRRSDAWFRRSWRWLTASAILFLLAAGAVVLTPGTADNRADKAPRPMPVIVAPADRG